MKICREANSKGKFVKDQQNYVKMYILVKMMCKIFGTKDIW